MTKYRAMLMSSSVAMAIGLAACGGAGGEGVAVLPAPPGPPQPVKAIQSGEPLRATAGTSDPVMATQDGANFATGAVEGTAFPMLQTAIEQNGGYVAMQDLAGTATVRDGQVEADVDGATTTIADGSLDWTRAGYWNIPTDWFSVTNSYGVFVVGYQTPAADVPTAGSASFQGSAAGYAFTSPDGPAILSGNASFTADFGSQTLSGELTNMTADGTPWNSVAFTSTISGNAFSGTTSVTSVPSGSFSLGANATGTLEGAFFGPSAQEAGAVWTLFDGAWSAIGTLTGRR